MKVTEQEYATITLEFRLDEAELKRKVYSLFDGLSIMMSNQFRGDAQLLIEALESITSRYVKALRGNERCEANSEAQT